MADDLADGEFWLPSQFLTDDDILQDFKSDLSASGFGSDVGSLTTETETSSDDDDGLLLPRNVLGSPQSTLCGWDHGSPTVPESPAVKTEADGGGGGGATLDLLNKAAGEVAKMKLRTEMKKNGSSNTTTTVGTGFFDCSVKAPKNGGGMFSPSQPPQHPPVYPPQFYAYPHFRRFPPHLMWIPPPPPPPQVQKRPSNNKTATINNNNRPLGLPPSAWPPLPGQAQAQTQAQQQQKQQTTPSKAQAQAQQSQTQQPMMRMYVGPQSVSVGTGVFLPRRVTNVAAAEPKKKSDGNATKTKNNKASQRRNSRPTKANDDIEIQLPSEWVY